MADGISVVVYQFLKINKRVSKCVEICFYSFHTEIIPRKLINVADQIRAWHFAKYIPIPMAPWQFDCSEYKEMTIKCFLSNKERIICVFAIVLHYVPNNPYMNVNTRPPFLDVSLGLTVCNKWLLPAHPQGPNNMTLPF